MIQRTMYLIADLYGVYCESWLSTCIHFNSELPVVERWRKTRTFRFRYPLRLLSLSAPSEHALISVRGECSMPLILLGYTS